MMSDSSSEPKSDRSLPGNLVIKMGPPPTFNITCYGFHLWAEDFLSAEKLYAPTARQGSLVGHFLCCQSVELSLKGFLSLKGLKRTELRKRFGHNLVKLYTEARMVGIGSLATLKSEDVNILTKANAWYDSAAGKKFQYFDAWEALNAFKSAPELSALEDIAGRLQSEPLREAVLKGYAEPPGDLPKERRLRSTRTSSSSSSEPGTRASVAS